MVASREPQHAQLLEVVLDVRLPLARLHSRRRRRDHLFLHPRPGPLEPLPLGRRGHLSLRPGRSQPPVLPVVVPRRRRARRRAERRRDERDSRLPVLLVAVRARRRQRADGVVRVLAHLRGHVRVRHAVDALRVHGVQLRQLLVARVQHGCLLQEHIAHALELRYFSGERLLLLVQRNEFFLVLVADVLQPLGQPSSEIRRAYIGRVARGPATRISENAIKENSEGGTS